MVLIFLSLVNAFGAVPEPASQSYKFTYQVEISRPENKFQKLKVWIPMAAQNFEQEILREQIKGIRHWQIHTEKEKGNRMLFFTLGPTDKFPVHVEISYFVRRHWSVQRTLAQIKNLRYWQPKLYLGPNQRVPIDGIIQQVAENAVADAQDTDEKIRRIYSYVVSTMNYNKEGKGWGEGDAIWACNNKRGNCTDFHSLLIGMARSQKIPAKFEIGFLIPPSGEGEIAGYHCWARMYSDKLGWIPVDASESKKAGDHLKYFGSLPHNRIHFTSGRDLNLKPQQKGPRLNYFIYPYMEMDGQKYESYSYKFRVGN